MAKILKSNEIKNISEYPNSFKRQGAFPLDLYSLFFSKEEAEAYAKNDELAYVGQVLTLVLEEPQTVETYVVQHDGTLSQVGGLILWDDKYLTSQTENKEEE